MESFTCAGSKGALRTAQPPRRLALAKPFQVTQHDRLPQPRGEPGQGVRNSFAEFTGIGRIGWTPSQGRVPLAPRAAGGSPLQIFGGPVRGAMKPAGQVVMHPFRIPGQRNEDGLSCVFRVLIATKLVMTETQHPRAMPSDHHIERFARTRQLVVRE